jgi:type IV pilus assembly protein PilE
MMIRNKMRGFTLIEAMIVVALIGLIAAIGYPAYRDQVMKSRRAEGMGELLELADRMERYYSDKGTYVGATLGNNNTDIYRSTTAKSYYTLAIIAADTTNIKFKVTATPENSQKKDKCGAFILYSDGNKEVAPPPLYSTPDPSMVGECWK